MNLQCQLLANVIEGAGLGVPGVSLFIDHTPDSALEAIMIRVPLAGVPINHYLPNYYKGDFQIIVRSKTNAAGSALADRLFALLTIQTDTRFVDAPSGRWMLVHHMLPRTQPIAYQRSPANLLEWSINLAANYVLGQDAQ